MMLSPIILAKLTLVSTRFHGCRSVSWLWTGPHCRGGRGSLILLKVPEGRTPVGDLVTTSSIYFARSVCSSGRRPGKDARTLPGHARSAGQGRLGIRLRCSGRCMAVTDRGDLQSYLDGRGLMVDIRSVEGIAPPPPGLGCRHQAWPHRPT